jgi:hypothetical protein
MHGAQARGLMRRGQDLPKELAPEVHRPAPVVMLRSHVREMGSGEGKSITNSRLAKVSDVSKTLLAIASRTYCTILSGDKWLGVCLFG